MAEHGFKLPVSVPQDLLLIQDIVGVVPPPALPVDAKDAEDIDSSGSSSDASSDSDVDAEEDEGAHSEDEVERDLLAASGMNTSSGASAADPASSSESEGDDEEKKPVRSKKTQDDLDEDAPPVPLPANSYYTTPNELSGAVYEANIRVPDFDEVGLDEPLEVAGEVMSVTGLVVIVKGISNPLTNGKGQERALDSDTLLVFEDRKVMGYIFETFGPTSQPLYQIRFRSSPTSSTDVPSPDPTISPATTVAPLPDPARVYPGRAVFHVPTRSRFVFPSQLRLLPGGKGTDASNLHDEEPADDEMEFSDDEKEMEWKRMRKRERSHSRAGSVASSRYGSPAPSTSSRATFAQMRDQELAGPPQAPQVYHVESLYGASPYDAYGEDAGTAGPSSRPAPLPYDIDPYSDAPVQPAVPAPTTPSALDRAAELRPKRRSLSPTEDRRGGGDRQRDRDRGRGRGRGRGGRGGRGGDRNPQQNGRGRGRRSFQQDYAGPSLASSPGYGYGDRYVDQSRMDISYGDSNPSAPSSAVPQRAVSPTSAAIARATGHFDGASSGGGEHAYSPSVSFMPPASHVQQEEHWQNQQPHSLLQQNWPAPYAAGMNAGMPHWAGAHQQPHQHQHQHQHSNAYGHGQAYGQIGTEHVQPHINPRFASMFGMQGMQGMQNAGAAGGGGMAGHGRGGPSTHGRGMAGRGGFSGQFAGRDSGAYAGVDQYAVGAGVGDGSSSSIPPQPPGA